MKRFKVSFVPLFVMVLILGLAAPAMASAAPVGGQSAEPADAGYAVESLGSSMILTATGGVGRVDLSWTTVPGATSYKLYRSLLSGGPYTTVTSVVYTDFTDLNVVPGVTYYYVVTVGSPEPVSGLSNEASATPLAPPPPEQWALLLVIMENGMVKEYDLPILKVNNFIQWYNQRAAGSGSGSYVMEKTYNLGPFVSRMDYLVFDKILTFEVLKYER